MGTTTSCNEVSTSELIPGESLFINTLYLFFYRGVRLSSGTNSGLLTLAVCTSDDSGQSLMRYMYSCRVPGKNVLSCIICLSRSWQREDFFFSITYIPITSCFLKRFQHVRTVLFKRKLKYLKRMIMKYNSQYIDIKNIYRLLRIVLRLVSWTHSNDSQHLCLEGEACHTKRLNKTQLTHLPYHANHSQMSIAFAHEAALAMERRSVNYQF